MYTSDVIISHFDDVRRKFALTEKRDVSVRAVARETGIPVTTLKRVADKPNTVNMATIETLCRYFRVRSVTELIEWKPEPPKPETER